MGKNLIDRYIWLIEVVNQAGDKGITFKEINKKWHRCSLSDKKDYPLRTFHNHRSEIKDIFKIEIACKLETNKYYIAPPKRKQLVAINNFLLFAISVNNILKTHPGLSKRIILDDIVSFNYSNIYTIINAIEKNKKVNFTIIEKTDTSNEFEFNLVNEFTNIEPYFVRCINNTFFLTCLYNGKIQTFNIADFENVEIAEESFKINKDFDISDYISQNAHEFIVNEDEENEEVAKKRLEQKKLEETIAKIGEFSFPAKDLTAKDKKKSDNKDKNEKIEIHLRIKEPYRSFFKETPLHSTQKVIASSKTSTLFSYYLKEDEQLYTILKALGNKAEIIAPMSLRRYMQNEFSKAKIAYSKNKNDNSKNNKPPEGTMIELF